MKIPTKKLDCGFELPVYGLGLWQMGGRWEIDTNNDAKEIEAIRAALDAGITHIDTAESYGNGHAEELLGEAIKGYDRSNLIIATKVSAWNQAYDNLRRSFESSLERIGTDYVDLYLLHRYPETDLPIAETMKAMDKLVQERLVRYIGVCNVTPNRFREAQRHTRNKLVCNQVHYNVQHREVEDKNVVQFCQDNDVMLVAWRPLQKGSLLDKPILQQMANRYGKTPAQIAINWLILQDHVVTLSKTSNINHLKENLGAIGWTMDTEDIEKIRREFPDQKLVSDAVPLDYAADIGP